MCIKSPLILLIIFSYIQVNSQNLIKPTISTNLINKSKIAYPNLIIKSKTFQRQGNLKLRLDGPPRVYPAPAIIIKSEKKSTKLIVLPLQLAILNPSSISKLELLNDSSNLSKYGKAAKYGVLIISFLSEGERKIFRKIKKYLTPL